MDSNCKEISLPATLDSVPQAIEFLKYCLEELGCSQRAQTKLVIIVDEIVSNIAKYAYKHSTGSVTIKVLAEHDEHFVELTFVDEGIAFNPLDALQKDTKVSETNRRIGGQGIPIVQTIADEIKYERKEGKNILRIRKHIGR